MKISKNNKLIISKKQWEEIGIQQKWLAIAESNNYAKLNNKIKKIAISLEPNSITNPIVKQPEEKTKKEIELLKKDLNYLFDISSNINSLYKHISETEKDTSQNDLIDNEFTRVFSNLFASFHNKINQMKLIEVAGMNFIDNDFDYLFGEKLNNILAIMAKSVFGYKLNKEHIISTISLISEIMDYIQKQVESIFN